jgi:hypothetical protein
MNFDPYNKLIEIMREEGSVNNPLPFLVGTVMAAYPDIIIKVDTTQFDKEDFLISENIINTLQIGDKVTLLISANQQEVIVLSKVVKL